MNRLSLLLICATILSVWGCSSSSSSSSHPQPLTVKTNIQTSDSAGNPSAVDPANSIILEFSEPLDMNTIEGKVSLHIVKAGGRLVSAYPPVEIISDSQEPKQIVIRTKNGTNFLSGEEYKLVVSMDVQSIDGNALKQDFVGYFATDYKFDYGSDNIPELGNDRLMIIIISDIHMGDLRSKTGGYGWFNKNSAKLVNFLNLA